MTEPTVDRSELFLSFNRRKMIALLGIVIVVGAIGLAILLTPSGPAWRTVSRASLIPVAIAIIVAVQMSLRGRRWAPDSPEVRMAMQDEWWKTNMDRASRIALVVVLLSQYPLAWLFGLIMSDLPQPRPSFAMAFATITLGAVTQLGLFLYFDRES